MGLACGRLIAAHAALIAVAASAAAQPYAYVANLGADEVAIFDTATRAVIGTLPTGDDPDGAAAAPDGTRVFIANFLSDSLSIIDTAANAVIATVPVGSAPVGVAVAPDGRRAYVANRGDDSVSVIDTAAASVVATIPVGRGPNAIAITPDGATAYVTNSFTRDPGLVSVIDLATDAVRATIPVQHIPNRVAITPDGATAYVTNFRSWNVSAIEVATDQVVTTIRVGYKPTGIAVNPNGAYAYVTVERPFREFSGNLQVIDVAAQRVRESLVAGEAPSSIGLLRNGGAGYVTNFRGDSLTVVDLGDEIAIDEVAIGRSPFAVAVSCVGDGCSETAYTPKPTRTVTLTPTDTPTPTATATPTQTATRTRTATLLPGRRHVEISLHPLVTGDTQVMDVRLDVGGQQVAGFRHDVLFPPGVRVSSTGDGQPECETFEGPPLSEARFEFLPAGCRGGCDGIRASLRVEDPLFDRFEGQTPYYCFLDIDPDLGVGTYRLRNTHTGADGPDGEVLATRGIDGIVTIQPPTSPSPVLSPRPTRTPMATSTATRTPVPEIFLNVGSASGRPGEQISITVSLDARGRDIAGIQNDLLANAAVTLLSLPNGRPDCSVNPAINKGATAFSFLDTPCGTTMCRGIRALVLALDNTDPIPDGALLFTCRMTIAAAPPGSYPLRSANPGGSDPHGADIPIGVVDGSITVLGAAATRVAHAGTVGASRCSRGASDGATCAADPDCPGGACVRLQGICDGGEDGGLLCDCPGGSCAAQPACDDAVGGGTCRGGDNDGACCDRSFTCRGGGACIATHRLCIGGSSKGMPCVGDEQCIGGRCEASGRRCAGGDFDGVSCVDHGDCPRATCLDPNLAPPTATASPTPMRGNEDDGCAIGPARGNGALLLIVPALLVARRRRRSGALHC